MLDYLNGLFENAGLETALTHFYTWLKTAYPSFLATFSNNLPLDWLNTLATCFGLISLAEMGDKSQLVCMALAARYKPTPVLLGAITAFLLLNTLAVIFGLAIADWLPHYLVAALVAILFTVFGLPMLLTTSQNHNNVEISLKNNRNVFIATFLLITLAEFGDKTQLAVIALSVTHIPLAVWLGASLALILTSCLGVVAGQTVLQKVPLPTLHKLSGSFFLLLAVFAGHQAYSDYLNK